MMKCEEDVYLAFFSGVFSVSLIKYIFLNK